MKNIFFVVITVLFIVGVYSCTPAPRCNVPNAYNYGWQNTTPMDCSYSGLVFYTQVVSSNYGRSNIYPLQVYLDSGNTTINVGQLDSAALVVPNSCSFPVPSNPEKAAPYLPYTLHDSMPHPWRAVSSDPTIVFSGTVQASQGSQCLAVSVQ